MSARRGLLALFIAVAATCVIAQLDANLLNNAPSQSVQHPLFSSLRKRRAAPSQLAQASTQQFQSCIAPGSRPGHCKHLSSCGDETYRSNFPRMLDYMCIIEQQFVGVCCPDDAASTGPVDAPPAGGSAGTLPAVATEGEDAIAIPGVDTVDRMAKRSRGCGISARDQSRVTGGKPTSSWEWPWVVALLRLGQQFCGGVLITDRHVLTAAHCVAKHSPREMLVRLGEYDLRFPNETRALDFRVLNVLIHSAYEAPTYANDIAIIKIHRPTIFNTYIWPVCLPPVGAVFENKQATVVGWGTTEYAGAAAAVLMEVTVPIWPQDKCVLRFTQDITKKHICAGTYTGNGDACQGDSGGPLMVQLGNGRWVTVGIVSWGIGCGNPDQPGIYTRVNAYLDWIFANTRF